MAEFGDILSELMIENNISSKELSKKIGISEATICTWRSNEHGIQLSNLVTLCKLFNSIIIHNLFFYVKRI